MEEKKEKKSVKKTIVNTNEKTTTKKTTTKKAETVKKENIKEISKPKKKTNSTIKEKNSIDKKEVKPKKKVENKTTLKEEKKVVNEYPLEEDSNETINNKLLFAIIFVLSIIFLFLLSNQTFFRNTYKNGNFEIDIPLFTYFIRDNGSTVTFKTLRKSEYTRSYYEEYLKNLNNYDYYLCNDGSSIYYNSNTKIAIKKIDVSKKFALKTVKIDYEIISDSSKVCK